MATLFISEHEDYRGPADGNIIRSPAITSQTVTITSSSVSSVSFQSQTRVIRVHADTTCSVLFGVAPSATLSSPRMATGQTEYYALPSTTNTTLKVAVIANS